MDKGHRPTNSLDFPCPRCPRQEGATNTRAITLQSGCKCTIELAAKYGIGIVVNCFSCLTKS